MLYIAHCVGELNFSQLMEVYIEGNLEKAEEGLSLLEAEQDFYQYLNDVFFRTPDALYCIWIEDGSYISALRMEPYRDGWLLEALETAPQYRRRGYGRMLVNAVTQMPEFTRIYSHIHRNNTASLGLHEVCGFRKISDYGVYIDGSVNRHTFTYVYQSCKSE